MPTLIMVNATQNRHQDSGKSRLDFLLDADIPDDVEIDDIVEQLAVVKPTLPDAQEATRQLLEQVVALARRPHEALPAANVTVHPPVVQVQAPSVTIQAAAHPTAVPWTFEFDRFPNGSIKAIHATPRINP